MKGVASRGPPPRLRTDRLPGFGHMRRGAPSICRPVRLPRSLGLLSSLLGVSSIKHFTPLKSISPEWRGEGPIWFHLALWG